MTTEEQREIMWVETPSIEEVAKVAMCSKNVVRKRAKEIFECLYFEKKIE